MGKQYGSKLNLGAGVAWTPKQGWEVLDHGKPTAPLKLREQAWCLPYPKETFEVVFSSHVVEHISHFKIEQVLCEINRVMKVNGILRLLTPDLKKLATAYVNNNSDAMNLYIEEDGSGIKTTLGLGQGFMNFIVSAGHDNALLSSDYSTIVAGYAHIYSYDYEMLSGLLQHYGFHNIRQCGINDSEIDDHRELRVGPFDKDKNHSLIVECRKRVHVPFTYVAALLHTGPYDVRFLTPRAFSPLWVAFKILGHIRNTAIFFLSKLPTPLRSRLRRIFGN